MKAAHLRAQFFKKKNRNSYARERERGQRMRSAFTELNVLPHHVSDAGSAHECPAHNMHAKKPTD
jgi:hypothetical protein